MNHSPFPIRGVVEGFYGTFYTFPQRNDLIRFLGRHGFNLYVYGPKNDRHHRAYWRRPYPTQMMAGFAETVALGREVGVDFCYTISPGESICFSSDEDFAALTAKLERFYRVGVRTFGLFLDDIIPAFYCDDDRRRYSSDAAAQADLGNRLYAWLHALDPRCRLTLCPTAYWGVAPFSPYLHELGERLHPAVDVFYTGPDICTPAITAADVAAYAETMRRPPLIWDNYPVNDLAMRPEMHIGPLRGRDVALHRAARGFVANLMLQPEASKVPLLTVAAYLADPLAYDPERAWRRALWEVAGAESAGALHRFAENSLFSCLGTPEAPKLDRLAAQALAALERGEPASGSPAVDRLYAYLCRLDEACYHLRYYVGNLELRQDLVPWVELLDLWNDLGRQAINALRAHERGESYRRPLYIMREWYAAIPRHHKRIAGRGLLPLAAYAFERLGEAPVAEAPVAEEV